MDGSGQGSLGAAATAGLASRTGGGGAETLAVAHVPIFPDLHTT